MGHRPSWLNYQLSSLKVLKREGKFKLPKWQIFQFEHLFNKKGTQSTMTSYSYNWPQFLIRRRFTYPDDLPMTSNSLCEAVSNMFPSSLSEQYWSDQKGGNPMLQIKYKGILPQWTSSASVWPQFLIRSRFTYPNDLKQPLRGWYFFLTWVVLVWSKRGELNASNQEKGNLIPLRLWWLNLKLPHSWSDP
jgi:hypothetical protein